MNLHVLLGRQEKSRFIFMSQKTTKAVPPPKANRFTCALFIHPFFTPFLFLNFHKSGRRRNDLL
jgi:hypothetical protein